MECHTAKGQGYGIIFINGNLNHYIFQRDGGNMDGNRHKEIAQRAPSGKKIEWKENYTLFKQHD